LECRLHPLILFFDSFLQALNTKNIPFASLRYKPLDEAVAFEGDYDFLTPADTIETILQTLFDLAAAASVNFVIDRVKAGKTKLFLYHPLESRSIAVEIWSHLEVRDTHTLGYIFYEDIATYIKPAAEGYYRLETDVELLYYLSHLKTKNKRLDDPLIRMRLAHYRSHPNLADAELKTHLDALTASPKTLAEHATWANARLVDKGVLFTYKHRDKKRLERLTRLRISRQRIHAQWLRRVRIIPVVGPDGVGKTSLIDALKSRTRSKMRYYRFKNLFRHNLWYQILRRLKRDDAKNLEKNQFDDRYGAQIVTIASWRYPLLVLMTLLRRGFLFSDRFFHDFILEDTRFVDREAHLRSNWKALLTKTPRSYWFVHLDAPSALIRSRKEELSIQAIDCYRRDIFRLYLEKPAMIYSYINTENTIEHCADVLLQTAKAVGIKAKSTPKALDEALILGHGNERYCYSHPHDETKVIKVTHRIHRNQNAIDVLYYAYLEKRNTDFSHLTRCYGWVEIEGVKGVMFDRVSNEDGSALLTLSEAITQKLLPADTITNILETRHDYLQRERIIFADVSLDNILCQRLHDGSYKGIIVDGLGSRRLTFKFWLLRHLPFYAAYRVGHQWKKVMENVKKLSS